MVENLGKVVAFDGLSLSGKSTMVEMLLQRSENAAVLRENTRDPLRNATASLNKLLKTNSIADGLASLMQQYSTDPLVAQTASDARQYVEGLDLSGPRPEGKKQAILAYFFAVGRSHVNKDLLGQLQTNDVILDRWTVTSMAYQTWPSITMAQQWRLPQTIIEKIDPEDEAYTWNDIAALNARQHIRVPDMQIILTCPINEIAQRKAYRQKEGAGTAGQMSGGKEELIYQSLVQIYEGLRKSERPSIMLENKGGPVQELEQQIRQAIPTYLALEAVLRQNMGQKTAGLYGYRLSPDSLTVGQAEEFFLDPANKEKIHLRQTT